MRISPRLVLARSATLAALSGVIMGAGVSPVEARETAAISISVAAGAPTALTGTPVDFTIGYSCLGAVACENTTITVPLPEFVDASEPLWGYDWWEAPLLTPSADVVATTVDVDGSATFTMRESLSPGTTGTVGIRYTPSTVTTPDGAALTVEATMDGSDTDPESASASMLLSAPVRAVSAQVSAGQVFDYLDTDLAISAHVGLTRAGDVGVQGIEAVESFSLSLPAGTVFVSSDPMPDVVSDETLTWNDLPEAADSFNPGARELDVVVRFPSSIFRDGQLVRAEANIKGSFTNGSSFGAAADVELELVEFIGRLDPSVQVDASLQRYLGQVAGRGVPYSWRYNLNNTNSTTPAVSAVVSTDLDDAFALESVAAPIGASIGWTSDSGAAGTHRTTTNDPQSLADLGVPDGDRPVHVDVDFGAVGAGTTSTAFGLSGTTTDPSVSSVELCGALLLTSASGEEATASDCGTQGIVDPFIVPSVWLHTPDPGPYAPGHNITWSTSIANERHGDLLEPVLYFLAPQGTEFAADPISWATFCTPAEEYANPQIELKRNALDGRDLLEVSWPGAPALARGDLNTICGLHITTTVTTAAPGIASAAAYLGDARGPIIGPFTGYQPDSANSSTGGALVGDDRGIVAGGSNSSVLARDVASVPIASSASLRSDLTARGTLDDDFVSVPGRATTESGSTVDYRLRLQNTGNIPLAGTVIYDILPHVGDTGVSAETADEPRGSQFAPLLQGAVAAPAGFSVEYSNSTNPCRPEVNPAAVLCDDDWTTAPADFGAVRSLKFVQEATIELAAGATADLVWSMQIAQDTPTAQLAFTSAAFSTIRTDNGQALRSEPAPIGVEVAVAHPGPPSGEDPAPSGLEGSLASTGVSVALTTALGLVILIAGILLTLARRRRTRDARI